MNGWKKATLGDVIEQASSVDPRKEPKKQFTYIDVSSVSNLSFKIESPQILMGEEAPSRARRLIQKDDVLFATVRPTLKRIAIVPPEYDGQVCSTGYFVFRLKPFLDPRFLYYFLLTDIFMEQMELLQTGASYPAVNDSQVKEQTIFYPSLSEQKRIVEILDEAFGGIAKATAKAQRNLANAQELFILKKDLLWKQTDNFSLLKFDDICLFVRGPFGGSLKKSMFAPMGIAVYEQSHAINDQFDEIRYTLTHG